MPFFSSILLSAGLLMLAVCPADGRTINIVPKPVSMTEQWDRTFIFPDKAGVYATDAELMNIAITFVGGISQNGFPGFRITSSERKADVKLYLDHSLSEEEYILDSSPEGLVVITGGSSKGVWWGLQTFEQILHQTLTEGGQILLPTLSIKDNPRFPYRGAHLDCCRYFFTVEQVKSFIDMISLHKINIFHWHLTNDQGWRIEILRYPLLTEVGSVRSETLVGHLDLSDEYDGIPHSGYYTQEQIRDIVAYAAARQVTIIPEIEMPGHALAAIACYPELSCGLEKNYELATRWGVFRQVYCPKAGTFEFLENVLDEVMELFPSEYIHIGGDECPKTSWKQCPHCQELIYTLGLKDEFELQSFFVQRIEKYINSRGRRIIGWDEILQGGLAPDATVMSWLGEEGGISAARQGHDAIMCPHDRYYLDYYQADPRTEKLAMGHLVTLKKMYGYNPVPDTLSAEQRKHIIGVQGCVWTEYMPTAERVEYMAWPRAAAIAEAGWAAEQNKQWDDFRRRLEKHFERFGKLEVPACRAFFDAQINVHDDGPWSKVVTLEADVPGAEIRYTTDGSEPAAGSQLYGLPFVINRSETVRAAVFRGGKRMGRVTQRGFE